jgi:hypothetical protein
MNKPYYPRRHTSAYHVLAWLQGRESFSREELTAGVMQRFYVNPKRIDQAVKWLMFSPWLRIKWNDLTKRWDVLFVADDPKEVAE